MIKKLKRNCKRRNTFACYDRTIDYWNGLTEYYIVTIHSKRKRGKR